MIRSTAPRATNHIFLAFKIIANTLTHNFENSPWPQNLLVIKNSEFVSHAEKWGLTPHNGVYQGSVKRGGA